MEFCSCTLPYINPNACSNCINNMTGHKYIFKPEIKKYKNYEIEIEETEDNNDEGKIGD